MACRQTATDGGFTTTFGPFKSEADCLNRCAEGACCEGTTCIVKKRCQCTGTGAFKGVGTTCTTNRCKNGACCVTTSVGGVFCNQSSEGDCVAAGGKYQGDGTACDNCGAALQNATITAITDFGSVSVTCSGRDGNGIVSNIVRFPCGFAYGASPLGGNYNTYAQVILVVFTKPCVPTLNKPLIMNSQLGCNSNDDTVGASEVIWDVNVLVSRADAWGNYGFIAEKHSYFRLDLTSSSVSAVKVLQRNYSNGIPNNCGVPPPGWTLPWRDARYDRCPPCGQYVIPDSRFTCGGARDVNAAQTDCCVGSLEASLTVTT
jgi:hypothetical protein